MPCAALVRRLCPHVSSGAYVRHARPPPPLLHRPRAWPSWRECCSCSCPRSRLSGGGAGGPDKGLRTGPRHRGCRAREGRGRGRVRAAPALGPRPWPRPPARPPRGSRSEARPPAPCARPPRLFCRLMDGSGPNLRRLYVPGLEPLKVGRARARRERRGCPPACPQAVACKPRRRGSSPSRRHASCHRLPSPAPPSLTGRAGGLRAAAGVAPARAGRAPGGARPAARAVRLAVAHDALRHALPAALLRARDRRAAAGAGPG